MPKFALSWHRFAPLALLQRCPIATMASSLVFRRHAVPVLQPHLSLPYGRIRALTLLRLVPVHAASTILLLGRLVT